ncbi:hypothetical protein A2982_00560 [candidate division WWE3 bacterium RIFCSPLOWO2_01_FULL_39_13]|uniref:Uncharacterized protein n=1 Tax=candidate division WWE3 bacterium RIFCSPLOWO2_01_FULL_39_13 TaxID=1802624 RepID=A0A1F4V3Z6_UNCKA|nr:MAG: hypothetical protein A2982_00560 [candidate division WWE3 bacterium RIFCSPLOWO2_01_FULL_39_13]
MDKKVFNYSELLTFPPDSTIGSATTSPLSKINGPHIFYAYQGNPTYTSLSSVVMGTVVGCRNGSDTIPYKFDAWRIISTGTASLVRYKEIKKNDIPYHHTNEIPEWKNKKLL